jgi:hypothetical protein
MPHFFISSSLGWNFSLTPNTYAQLTCLGLRMGKTCFDWLKCTQTAPSTNNPSVQKRGRAEALLLEADSRAYVRRHVQAARAAIVADADPVCARGSDGAIMVRPGRWRLCCNSWVYAWGGCLPATDQHTCTSQGILYRIALDNVDFCILTDQTLRSTPDLERRMREIDSKAPFPEGPIKWETLLGCKLAVKTSGCGPEHVQTRRVPARALLYCLDQTRLCLEHAQ